MKVKTSALRSVFYFVLLSMLVVGPSQAAEFRGGGTANVCLDVPNSEDGTRAQFWSCNGKDYQFWSILPTGVIRGLDGKCLDWHGGDGERNGTRVQVWTCHYGENQQWTLTNGEIRSKGGFCLSSTILANGEPDTTNGTDLILWECNGNKSQKWIVQ